MANKWSGAALTLVGGVLVWAQTTGTVEGVVWDPSGAVIPGAALRLLEVHTGSERRLATGPRGRYQAPGLAPGTYRVEVSQPPFRPQVYEGVELPAGRTVELDFHLQLGVLREALVVAAEAPVLSTHASDWGRSVERRQLDQLPLNGRDLFELAVQQPGATAPKTPSRQIAIGSGLHLSVHGARTNQNSFRMDGIYVNTASGTAPASAARGLLGLEGIEELRLITSPFSAEYGRAAGAVLTAVSKSGSNELHGSFYEFVRNSAVDARNFFDPADQGTPPLRKNQFGALVSGPLRRNRLFFLGNHEGIRELASLTVKPITLTASARQGLLGARSVAVAPEVRPYLEVYPLPNGRDFGDGTAEFITDQPTRTREDYLMGKLNAVLSERWRQAVRYTFDDAGQTYQEPFHLWNFQDPSRYQFLHAEWQWTQSPRSLQAFRAGLSRIRNAEVGTPASGLPASLSFLPGRPLGTLQVVGLTDVGGLLERQRPRQFAITDFQASHTLTHVRSSHTLSAGASFDRIGFQQTLDLSRNGRYQFNSVTDLLLARPRFGDLMMPGSDSARSWRQNIFTAFFQDEFRLHRRLSLTLGARYEFTSVPGEVHGKVATLPDPLRDAAVTVGGPLYRNPSRKNFAPRAALAWSPPGFENTVIRTGAGVFCDLPGTRELVVAGARTPPFFNRLQPSNPPFPDLLAAARAALPPNTVDMVDYYPLQPYVMQFQLSLERRLGRGTLAQLGYSGARGVHLSGLVGNINPPRPERLPDGRLFFPAEALRLNPAFDQISTRRTQFNSFYHGLDASLERRWADGLRFQAKYTFAKSIDESSATIHVDFLASDRVPTMFDYRANRGPSDFDMRHVLAANSSWQLPGPRGAAARRWLAGWELHGLLAAQSGHPFGPSVGFDRANLRGAATDLGQRPDFAALPGARVVVGRPEQYFDPRFYLLPAPGVYGNLGRNTLTGPGLAKLDAALHKSWTLREHHSLRLRLEAFNLANRPNFQIPSELLLFNSQGARVSSAGRITSTTTPARQFQAALKWQF